MPPGVPKGTTRSHQYAVEACGMEVVNIVDEPSAANKILKIEDGAVVDIGGGTTGISIIKNGETLATYDEATGGTHLSLVISGNYKISFAEAEKIKMDPNRQKEIFPIVRPVIEKMANIVMKTIKGHDVRTIYLVGGTCCLPGVEDVFESYIGVKTEKPENPLLITPGGIALSCL
jgi:ethanolamine utilization protein EutJ